MKVHSCPHCGSAHHAHGSKKHHTCHVCGGSFFSGLMDMAKKVASNPMVQSMAKSAISHVANKYAPGLMSKVQGVMSHPMAQRVMGHPMAQRAMAHPMVQHGVSALRKRVGLGRRRRGAYLPVGRASQGEMDRASMRAAGGSYTYTPPGQIVGHPVTAPVTLMSPQEISAARWNAQQSQPSAEEVAAIRSQRYAQQQQMLGPNPVPVLGHGGRQSYHTGHGGRQTYRSVGHGGRQSYHTGHGGKGGKPGGMPGVGQAAAAVANMIPGLGEALGPFGALLGIEPPPPPPPHASFGAVRAGPMEAGRPHGVGRGRHGQKAHHACPHCGGVHTSSVHTKKMKCKHCGGSFFSGLMDMAKKVASNPMVQSMAKSAISHVANKYAPGLTSKVHGLMAHPMAQKVMGHPMAQRAMAHPMVQHGVSALRKRVGLGRRTRPPTAHSTAVGKVMREMGLSLPEASKYVKHHGLAH